MPPFCSPQETYIQTSIFIHIDIDKFKVSSELNILYSPQMLETNNKNFHQQEVYLSHFFLTDMGSFLKYVPTLWGKGFPLL